jgi:hypothetical protein
MIDTHWMDPPCKAMVNVNDLTCAILDLHDLKDVLSEMLEHKLSREAVCETVGECIDSVLGFLTELEESCQ